MAARVRPRVRDGLGARFRVTITCVCLLLGAGLAFGLAAALAQSGSPSPAASSSPTSAKVILRVGWTHEPDNLNPFIGQVFSSYMVWYLTYDVLVGVDPVTLAPAKGPSSAGLATDWTVSPDGKTWTFTLRRGATWTDDHQPVTARDVAFTYNYVIDNQLSAFTTLTEGVKHVTAIDDYTVRFDCSQPKADMLLGAGSLFILPEHIWSKVPAKTVATSFPNAPPIVGSGPFQCVTFKKGGYVEMVANTSYWRGAPQIDEVLFENYTNEDTMAQDLKAGTLDACQGLLNAQLRMLQDVPGIAAQGIPTNGYDELCLNSYEPPAGQKSLGSPVLRDWRFRQALQWAVDKEKICAVVYGGHARPADTVITSDYYKDPDWHWAPPADVAYSFDLTKAGQLLDAAGYRDVNGDGIRESQGKPIELRLWSRTENEESQLEAKFMAGWFKQLGLKIELQTLDSGALTDRIYNTVGGKLAPDYDMFIWGWYNSLDPGSGLGYFTTAQINGWSDSDYSNAEYDRLYVEQGRAIDVPARKQLIDRMQQILYEQSPYVMLTYAQDKEAWNTAKWTGWERTPQGFGNVVIPPWGIGTYLTVRPVVVTGATTSGGGSTIWIAAAVVVVAVVLIVAIVLVRRRRGRAVEEAA